LICFKRINGNGSLGPVLARFDELVNVLGFHVNPQQNGSDLRMGVDGHELHVLDLPTLHRLHDIPGVIMAFPVEGEHL
jgi:hypothetical protein